MSAAPVTLYRGTTFFIFIFSSRAADRKKTKRIKNIFVLDLSQRHGG
jgi:hypothetical protein